MAAPLILASTSSIRRELLAQAGISFKAENPYVDETKIKQAAGAIDPGKLALLLAESKAIAVSNRIPNALILGADQVLNLDGRAVAKPASPVAAKRQLEELRGQAHWLETAVCCARAGKASWRHLARARLIMRNFSDEFLENYLRTAGEGVTSSVGDYKLEGAGIQLFEAIEGDYFTILGLPLLPLLAFLRSQGVLAQ
jgi:septum formation protein